LREYGAALKAGHTHLFETLPRLLTLWFSYADMCEAIAAAATPLPARSSSASKVCCFFHNIASFFVCKHIVINPVATPSFFLQLQLKKGQQQAPPASPQLPKDEANVNPLMNKLIDELPARLWYSSLAQLVSRICHPNKVGIHFYTNLE